MIHHRVCVRGDDNLHGRMTCVAWVGLMGILTRVSRCLTIFSLRETQWFAYFHGRQRHPILSVFPWTEQVSHACQRPLTSLYVYFYNVYLNAKYELKYLKHPAKYIKTV